MESVAGKECDPSAPATLVWSSGEQSGNGSLDSGPLSFPLLGCKGQILVLSYKFHKTYGDRGEDPPPLAIITGGGGNLATVHLGYSPIAEAEQLVLDANRPPVLSPMPTSSPSAWPPRASSDCRSLFVGDERFAFKFKRIGCWKATRLVARSWFGASPNAYRCTFARGGDSGRCARTADPRKFYAWHPPRKPRSR